MEAVVQVSQQVCSAVTLATKSACLHAATLLPQVSTDTDVAADLLASDLLAGSAAAAAAVAGCRDEAAAAFQRGFKACLERVERIKVSASVPVQVLGARQAGQRAGMG